MPKLTVKLLQPVFDGGARLETLTFDAPAPLPVSHTKAGAEIETVAVLHVIAAHAGITLSAVAKLSPADLMAISLVLFAPTPTARQRGANESKK